MSRGKDPSAPGSNWQDQSPLPGPTSAPASQALMARVALRSLQEHSCPSPSEPPPASGRSRRGNWPPAGAPLGADVAEPLPAARPWRTVGRPVVPGESRAGCVDPREAGSPSGHSRRPSTGRLERACRTGPRLCRVQPVPPGARGFLLLCFLLI